jgi:KipI family sensor histidine kinase inhibitor
MIDANVASPGVFAVGESAILIALGNGPSEELSARVRAAAHRVREASLPGVSDIVPAYNSVLVAFDPEGVDYEELEAVVRGLTRTTSQPRTPIAEHIIPVRYDSETGLDLEEIATQAGLSPGEVVRLHRRGTYVVAFIGFLPGFPYMHDLPARIAVPRRDTPRVSIPSGSVGIAARQTGIYPFTSPGGWQIIGQTPRILWDAQTDRPSLLSPGDRVRFVNSDERRREPAALPAPVARRPLFEVIDGGALTTIQDEGRFGYAHLGVGPSGVFDVRSARLANHLVGNPREAAVMEIALLGPSLRVLANTTVAVAGADFGCRVDGAPLRPGISWFVRAGSTLRFAGASAGMRAYLAVAGGLDVPQVLGSRSTSAYGKFGGYAGRTLREGDVLGVAEPPAEPSSLAGRMAAVQAPLPVTSGTTTLRYVPYDGPQSAGSPASQAFETEEWTLSERSDRMGLRLVSDAQVPGGAAELPSFPVVRGAIQLPPDGQPIILGPDHQTTGGYPLLGVVAACDWHRLAQAAPGAKLRFAPLDRNEARALSRPERPGTSKSR